MDLKPVRPRHLIRDPDFSRAIFAALNPASGAPFPTSGEYKSGVNSPVDLPFPQSVVGDDLANS
jgi:hypothetical protein